MSKVKVTLSLDDKKLKELRAKAEDIGVSLSSYLTVAGLKGIKTHGDLKELIIDKKLENQWTINDLIVLKINEIIKELNNE